jgi:hypothetical protein
MNITGKVVIESSPVEVERLIAILLDEDQDEAFHFLKDCVGRKLKDKIRPHYVPVFEASYSPRQKDRFDQKG